MKYNNNEWYNKLNKSILTPPNYIFKIVWPILYLSILISFLLYIFNNGININKTGFIFFIIQLILNLLWPIIFFYFKNPNIALIIIILMILSLILTIKNFYKVNKLSSFLLIPYLIWLLFAFYLNVVVIILNSIW